MLLTECILMVIAITSAFTFPEIASSWFASIELSLAKLARHKGLTIIVVGASALALRVVLLPITPIPQPGVHDEFSYLLLADTFAHARVTNPTHPMWVHFESFHIIQKPSYTSMYFPAQGLFLAAGQVIFDHPFWGVWMSGGLMCGAICWMLQGWLPPLWALLGGVLAVIRLATFSYWVNTYFGGNVAALGGALVLGSFPRIKRYQRTRDALLMGVGLALLANSRPYEGLFFSIPVMVSLLLWGVRQPSANRGVTLRRVAFPLTIVLSATIATMLYYFWRVTGDPFRTPFFVNLSQYDPVPYFPWRSVGPWPVYHHEIMRRFYAGWLLENYQIGHIHPITTLFIKFITFTFFYLGPLFAIPVLLLGVVLPKGYSFKDIRPRTRFLLLVGVTTIFGTLLPVFFSPHYAAPMTCVIYALVISALQCVRRWRWRGKPRGLALVRSVPTVALLLVVVNGIALALHLPDRALPQTWCSPYEQDWDRPVIQHRIENLPGQHLLIVRYGPNHDPRGSWVANAADIDSSKLVWANDMGPEKNQELINYFKDRKAWLVEPDARPAKLSEYTFASTTPMTDEDRLSTTH